jgi:hypothetical protein
VKSGALKKVPNIKLGKKHNNNEGYGDTDTENDDLRAFHFRNSALHPPPHFFKS